MKHCKPIPQNCQHSFYLVFHPCLMTPNADSPEVVGSSVLSETWLVQGVFLLASWEVSRLSCFQCILNVCASGPLGSVEPGDPLVFIMSELEKLPKWCLLLELFHTKGFWGENLMIVCKNVTHPNVVLICVFILNARNFKNVNKCILFIILSILWLIMFLFYAKFGIFHGLNFEMQHTCVCFSFI